MIRNIENIIFLIIFNKDPNAKINNSLIYFMVRELNILKTVKKKITALIT